jgi:hypothetical protein
MKYAGAGGSNKTARKRRALSGMGFMFVGVLLAGCSGPMLVTEYEGGIEVGEETVVYDEKGHPVVTSEQGYVDNPYAESYSIEKEDFRRQGNGVLPE